MAVYDIEAFCKDLEVHLRDASVGVNARLVAITAEKADNIVLDPIADGAYVFQTLNAGSLVHDPVIFYLIDNVVTTTAGPDVVKNYAIEIDIIVHDKGQDIAKHMLRYQRALEESLSGRNWTSIEQRKMRIESLAPVSFSLMNTANEYRAIGVVLHIVLN